MSIQIKQGNHIEMIHWISSRFKAAADEGGSRTVGVRRAGSRCVLYEAVGFIPDSNIKESRSQVVQLLMISCGSLAQVALQLCLVQLLEAVQQNHMKHQIGGANAEDSDKTNEDDYFFAEFHLIPFII